MWILVITDILNMGYKGLPIACLHDLALFSTSSSTSLDSQVASAFSSLQEAPFHARASGSSPGTLIPNCPLGHAGSFFWPQSNRYFVEEALLSDTNSVSIFNMIIFTKIMEMSQAMDSIDS